ncbi:hypothetical protein HDU91_003196, partial [Kappamyces sp. JEL0680]
MGVKVSLSSAQATAAPSTPTHSDSIQRIEQDKSAKLADLSAIESRFSALAATIKKAITTQELLKNSSRAADSPSNLPFEANTLKTSAALELLKELRSLTPKPKAPASFSPEPVVALNPKPAAVASPDPAGFASPQPAVGSHPTPTFAASSEPAVVWNPAPFTVPSPIHSTPASATEHSVPQEPLLTMPFAPAPEIPFPQHQPVRGNEPLPSENTAGIASVKARAGVFEG